LKEYYTSLYEILPKAIISEIFFNIEDILLVNISFLAELLEYQSTAGFPIDIFAKTFTKYVIC
jgi:hypothetical protein